VIVIIVFLSLALLVRTSGQVSLAHASFAAVGVATFSHLTTGAGLPWLLALLLAGLVTMPVGAVIAIPAIRLSGLYLALATFGFGILLERMVYSTALMFGALTNRSVPRPHFGGLSSDTGYYYLVLAIAVGAGALVWGVQRSRLGRLLRALSESPVALAHVAVNVNLTRLIVFCLSAFLAGIAGALMGGLAGSISGRAFGWTQSLVWLAVLSIVGRGELRPALAAALLLVVVPTYLPDAWTDWLTVAFGGSAVIVAMLSSGRIDPAATFRRLADRSAARGVRSPVRRRTAAAGLGGSTS
jgi:ABC-type branched-subunit amino acid transport system permease subunit